MSKIKVVLYYSFNKWFCLVNIEFGLILLVGIVLLFIKMSFRWFFGYDEELFIGSRIFMGLS